MSTDMERLTEAMEEYAIATNDFDVIAAESIAEGVLESTWLAEHDAKVRAEALREAYADLEAYTDSGAPFGHRPVEEFLLHRADRIVREAGLK